MFSPFISVVIATYSRPERLSTCLEAFSRLDYPADLLEIIVVDDGSPMSLQAAMASYSGKASLAMLRQSNAGAAAARNAGAKAAKGQYLAITDDDCLPASDWLRQFAKQLESLPDHALGGQIVNSLTTNACAAASQLLIDYLYDYYQGKEGRFFASNNMIVPAKRFEAIGGFDSSFPGAAAEDRDFFRRWLTAGFQMAYCANAVIFHAHEMNFYGFLRQHFRYGRGAFHYHSLKSASNNCKIRLEPAKFYTDFLPIRGGTKRNSIPAC